MAYCRDDPDGNHRDDPTPLPKNPKFYISGFFEHPRNINKLKICDISGPDAYTFYNYY